MKSKKVLWGLSGLAILIGGLSLSLNYKDNKVVETSAYNADSVAVVSVNGEEDVEYTSFALAWSDACEKSRSDSSTTFKLLSDWNATSGSFGTGQGFGSTGYLNLEYGEAGSLNIDLAGHNINRGLTSSTAKGQVLYINFETQAIHVVIKDSSSDNASEQGKIMGGYSSENGGGIVVYNSCSLDIKGGNITLNKSDVLGGGIYVCNYATLTMTGGRIYENIANMAKSKEGGAGAIYCTGTFSIYNASIDNNYSLGTRMGGYYGNGFTVGGLTHINNNYSDVTINDGVVDTALADIWNVTFIDENYHYITCSTATPIQEWSSIGVMCMNKDVVITTENTSDLSRFFTSDDSDYASVTNTDGKVQFILTSVPFEFVKHWRAIRDENHSICTSINSDAMTALLIQYSALSTEYLFIVDNSIEYGDVTIGISVAYVKAYRQAHNTSSLLNLSKEYPYLTESIILGAVSLTSLLAFVLYYRKRKKA